MSDNRINKAINDLDTIKVTVGEMKSQDKQDFTNRAKSTFDSIQSLIKRRDAIKRAVVLSNATVKVTIADETLTVAEAIERKTSLNYSLQLAQKLGSLLNQANKEEQKAKDIADQRIEQLLSSLYGRDKVSAKEAQEHTDNLRKQFEVVVYDALGTYDVQKGLVETIDTFLNEVDDVLAVANATTIIEISY